MQRKGTECLFTPPSPSKKLSQSSSIVGGNDDDDDDDNNNNKHWCTQGGGGLQTGSPPKAKFKITDFVDTVVSKILRDLSFSLNQPPKSTDD